MATSQRRTPVEFIKAATLFALTSHTDVLKMLGGWKGGLLVMGMTFAAGAGVNAGLSDLGAVVDRQDASEAWQDSIAPAFAELLVQHASVTELQDSVFARLDGIETRLGCIMENVPIAACPIIRPLRR